MTERRSFINSYIQEHGAATIAELASVLPSVSEMTIRRDLLKLEAEGEIVRTKGGAKSIMHLSMQKEDAYYYRESSNSDLKREIAEKVSPLLEDGTCVYFDAGSTSMHVVKRLQGKQLFAVTNSPNVALELIKNPSVEVRLTGGLLNRENISLSGQGAASALSGINIGTAVIAASGYSASHGFTCGSYNETELKRAVISAATRTIIIIDSSKIGKNLPFTFATPKDVDIVVTDSKISREDKAAFKKQGTKLV